MNWDSQSIAEIITAIAALVAAIQSWRSRGQAEKARQAAEEIRTEIRTEIKTTLATVLQHTQALQQTQTHTQQVNIHLPEATAGPALTESKPIFQSEQQERLPEGQVQAGRQVDQADEPQH